MLLNCINSFGQTKLVVQSIMHMKIYGKTDKKKKRNEKKNHPLNKHVGKVNLAYWLWHECPCHKQSNILWKELSVCTCISKRRKWKRSIRQTYCVCMGSLQKHIKYITIIIYPAPYIRFGMRSVCKKRHLHFHNSLFIRDPCARW